VHGKRVTVMGLGHFGGGVAAARWLARRGARVTVTDRAEETALADSLAALRDVPIDTLALGGHREEHFRRADLVVVNPAVRPGNPWVRIAEEAGAWVTSEIELLLTQCPAPVVGVTGTNGKSTTAAMIAAMLRVAGRRVWLGGNIGVSLLEQLDAMRGDDRVVLELSSFQLARLGPAVSMPEVAVVTGCSPNHLDWHPDYAHYIAAKQRILTGQSTDSAAILNTSDAEVSTWRPTVRGRLVPCALAEEVPPLSVPGKHNRTNAACAMAAAMAAGCPPAAARRALASFRPLPGRLEQIAEIAGRCIYNDTAATTPESTIAALETMDDPLWLLAGGADKGVPFDRLAETIARRCRGVAFFGSVGDRLLESLAATEAHLPATGVETMSESLDWCWRRSDPGHAILLSPACASTDQFRNYRDRGEKFAAMVGRLSPVASQE